MAGIVFVNEAVPAPANILSGSSVTVGSAQTLVTVPAGRTWKGTLSASIGAAAATTSYSAVFNTAGTGAVPAPATNLFAVSTSELTAASGESNANGTSGVVYVAAPAGNSVTVTVTATAAATGFFAEANGILLSTP